MSSKKQIRKEETDTIPVGASGYVPVSALRNHFENDVELPSGRRRNPNIDSRSNAKIVYPSKMTPEQAAVWWNSPNRSDVAGIDAHGAKPTRRFKKKTNKTAEKPLKSPERSTADTYTSDIPMRGDPKRSKKNSRDSMEYSASWHGSLPWESDPETALRMASEAMAIEDTASDEDMMAYLKDSRHDEEAENSRWTYDPRDTAKAYRAKKWDEFKTYGTCNRKSRRSRKTKNENTKSGLEQIVLVNEDQQGLYYPEYYTTVGDLSRNLGLNGKETQDLIEGLSGGTYEGTLRSDHTFTAKAVTDGKASLEPYEFSCGDARAVLNNVPKDAISSAGVNYRKLSKLVEKGRFEEANAMCEGIGFDISYWDVGKTDPKLYGRLDSIGIPRDRYRSDNKRSSRKKNPDRGPAVTPDSDIPALIKRYPGLKCDELCPNCGCEVSIDAYGISKCPNCGDTILPCSMCDQNTTNGCHVCPYKNEKKGFFKKK